MISLSSPPLNLFSIIYDRLDKIFFTDLSQQNAVNYSVKLRWSTVQKEIHTLLFIPTDMHSSEDDSLKSTDASPFCFQDGK